MSEAMKVQVQLELELEVTPKQTGPLQFQTLRTASQLRRPISRHMDQKRRASSLSGARRRGLRNACLDNVPAEGAAIGLYSPPLAKSWQGTPRENLSGTDRRAHV